MFRQWFRRLPLTLSRKYLLGVVAGLAASFAVFAVLFMLMYQDQLQSARAQSAHQFGQMLLVALQQPLGKGNNIETRALVNHLGGLKGVAEVMISDMTGRIRYASNSERISQNPLAEESPGCMACHALPPEQRPDNRFVINDKGVEVLRSVVPIARFHCEGCVQPSDPFFARGMVVVDYQAEPLRRQALYTTLFLMGSGAVVLIITLFGGWWFMRHVVLSPINALREASERVGNGELSTRTHIGGSDELAELGETFNEMTAKLETAMRDIALREAFQQALIDGIPDGIRVINDDYRIIAANRGYAQQIEKSVSEVTGDYCYASSHGRDTPCPSTLTSCPLRNLSEADETIKYMDSHIRSDGGEFDVEVFAARFNIEENGRSKSYIVESIRNLTEEIHYSHEQKLSDIGKLAAGVAHEIHNPLTTLKMALPHLEDADAPQELRKEYLQLIEHEVDRCIDVNDRLLRLSSLPPSHSELVDINTCVAETISLLHFEAEQRGQTLLVELSPDTPRSIATDSEVRMIVLNLAQNAFHAAPPNGLIRVSTLPIDKSVQIIVDDNGPGVPPEKVATIFEPFYSERRDSSRGTGLGLPITHSLVTRHGGSIRVETSPEGGARFIVSLMDADAGEES